MNTNGHDRGRGKDVWTTAAIHQCSFVFICGLQALRFAPDTRKADAIDANLVLALSAMHRDFPGPRDLSGRIAAR